MKICTTTTSGSHIGKPIGIKSSLVILDHSNNILQKGLKDYSFLPGDSTIDKTVATWKIEIEKIPLNCPIIKLSITFQAYDLSEGEIVAQETSAQLLASAVQITYADDFTQMLDNDHEEGTTTDAILKLGGKEYPIHKCVLGLQSDFFKARFSDRWEERKTAYVDMNDSDLSPELLETLVSAAYTGKVDSLEIFCLSQINISSKN